MFTRSHSLKRIVSVGSAAIAIIALSDCSGAGFGPPENQGNTPDLVDAPPSVSDSGPVAGAQPDLMVTPPAVSDSRPVVGQRFALSVAVRNDGDGASVAATLRYYRSTDATITTADTEVGSGTLTVLAASGSASESVDLTAPSDPGTYYYGACVDAVSEESDTANNCSTSVGVNVVEVSVSQGQPDLVVVTSVVSDSDPTAGAAFTLSATVRNDGEGDSAATTLRYYRSTDETITSSDTEVGTDVVAGLTASGTSSQSVELAGPAMPGTYYFGACVDAVADELDTANNCSAGAEVTAQEPERPDLMVAAPSVTDSGPAAGATFTLSATVRNDGEGGSERTTLRYYGSRDARITTSDTELGTDGVAALAASGSASESVPLTAPSTPGTHYFGVCVDAVTDESDTTNNCSTSVQVTVQENVIEPSGNPDLMVTSPSVSDSDPAVGTQFTLSAAVRNDGEGSSAATTLHYYRSADATITTSDTEVGTEEVTGLGAVGSSSQSVELTAPASPGTYYYGACVDAVADESDTTNNCSGSVEVTVPEPERPDLVVGTPSVSDSGPEAGAAFTLSATVRNEDEGESAATTLRYYRSTDATITRSDTSVGTDAIVGLAASGSSSQSVELTAPATPGTYYYGACVDAVVDESDTTNNCSGSVEVTVPEPEHSDLMVGTPSVSDSGPEAGAAFTLSATVRNEDEGESAATTLRYYRSTEAAITTSDMEVGTDAIGVLAAAGSSSQSVDLTAPDTSGTYYYGACVDAVTDESDTTNNCSGSVEVTVPEPKPDLVVGTLSVSDSGPEAGGTFTLSATVKNEGEGSSGATTLRYYRSTDTTITASDTSVGTDAIAELAAAGTSDQSVDLTAPGTSGTYYYGACVDAVTDESDTTNNCSGSVEVTVPEPERSDLVVGTPSVSDSGPEAGAAFTLSATVRNEDEGESAATTLRYYRSTDAAITTSDMEVGTDAIGVLAAAGSSSQSVDLTAPDTSGTYYYGACVDAVTDESDTTNNCSGSVEVTVPEEESPGPSLQISAEDDKEWAPVGDTVDLTASVLDEEGEEIAGATISWSSSNTAVATVDSSGMMTAVGEGTVTLTATATVTDSSTESSMAKRSVAAGSSVAGRIGTKSEQTVTDSVTMTVVKRAARIVVTPNTLSFDELGGSSKTLTATAYDAADNEIQATYHYSGWSSGDRGVVKVSPRLFQGLSANVQAIGPGTTTVTITAYGATATVTVTVTLTGRRVEVSPTLLTFEALGDTKTATVRVLDENGDEDTDATWYLSSGSSGLGFVSIGDGGIEIEKVEPSDGVAGGLSITANGTGENYVYIGSLNAKRAVLLVTVYQTPASLVLSPAALSLETGDTGTLRASILDANGHAIPLSDADTNSGGLVVYWATSDSDVATVAPYGDLVISSTETGHSATVTAAGEGTATITGRWAGNEISGTATITVTAPTTTSRKSLRF